MLKKNNSTLNQFSNLTQWGFRFTDLYNLVNIDSINYGIVFINKKKTNFFLTLTDLKGRCLFSISAGMSSYIVNNNKKQKLTAGVLKQISNELAYKAKSLGINIVSLVFCSSKVLWARRLILSSFKLYKIYFYSFSFKKTIPHHTRLRKRKKRRL